MISVKLLHGLAISGVLNPNSRRGGGMEIPFGLGADMQSGMRSAHTLSPIDVDEMDESLDELVRSLTVRMSIVE